jgi:hypothetical protein
MNNDLEQFSEERLKEIAQHGLNRGIYSDDLKSLARIALEAKQAKPVAQVYQPANIGICAALGPAIRMINFGLPAGTLLYTTPQPAHTEQDGWKLVPIEPTIGMLINGVIAGVNASPDPWCPHVWAAMLAAAPKPESE